jgi:hypothetical protein
MSDKHFSHDLSADFIFVPRDTPPPREWMAKHPNYVKIPATFVPHNKDTNAAAPIIASKAIPHALPIAAASAMAIPAAKAWSAAEVTEIGAAVLDWPFAMAAGALSLMIASTESQEADNTHFDNRDVQPDLPPVPGTTMHDESKPVPHKDGFVPPAPAPALPGFTPDTTASPQLPGASAEENAPLILKQDRNKDLPTHLRSNSARARDAARAIDPEVTNTLPAQDWQAHHLIGMASVKVRDDLLAAAARAGWRPDEPGNIVALPANPAAQEQLQAKGIARPLHDNKHSHWTETVSSGLKEIIEILNQEDYDESSEAYAKAARDAIEKLQEKLREAAMKERRLTQGETNGNAIG